MGNTLTNSMLETITTPMAIYMANWFLGKKLQRTLNLLPSLFCGMFTAKLNIQCR